MKSRKLYLFAIPVIVTATATAAVFTSNSNETINREYDAIGIEKLHIENSSGKVVVEAGDRPRALISGSKRQGSERCNFITEKTQFNELVIRVEKPLTESCEVDVLVTIPKTVDLSIWSSSGSVQIKGIEGKLSLNSGSGAVTALGKFNSINLKTGSGVVEVAGLTGGGDVSLGSGNVSLKYLDNPRGALNVTSGSGGASLLLPKDSKVNAKLNTGSGATKSDFVNSESAEFTVNMKTGSGNVEVKAY